MAKKKGATNWIPTKEDIKYIEKLAELGFTQDDIARKFQRDQKTLFGNNKEKYPEVYSAWERGKAKDKERLLEGITDLEDRARLQGAIEVEFKVKKYQLNIKHNVNEKTEADITTKGQALTNPFADMSREERLRRLEELQKKHSAK